MDVATPPRSHDADYRLAGRTPAHDQPLLYAGAETEWTCARAARSAVNETPTRPGRQLGHALIATAVAVLWVASLGPFFGFAASNHRLVEAFSPDEAMQLNLLHGAIARHSFALDFGPYGHLGFNLILLVLRVVPGTSSEADILFTGRALGALFAAGTALLTFAWAQRVSGTAAAWFTYGLVLLNTTLYSQATEINPDLVQLFFLMLALAFVAQLAEKRKLIWLTLASIAAGLAFASKYSGLFVLPVAALVLVRCPLAVDRPAVKNRILRAGLALGTVLLLLVSVVVDAGWIASHLTSDGRIDLPIADRLIRVLTLTTRSGGIAAVLLAVVPWPWDWLGRSRRALSAVWFTCVMVVVFLATFAVASPYSLRRGAFVKGLLGEATYAVPASVTSTADLLQRSAIVVGWPVALAALATIAALSFVAWRRSSRMTESDVVLTAWVAIYTLVLVAPVHEFYVHYALPLAPPVAMLAVRGTAGLTRWLGAIAQRRRLAGATLCLIAVSVELPLAEKLIDLRKDHMARGTSSDQAQVAAWLECHAMASARVAYDHFAYIPPTFVDATVTWGGTRKWLTSIDPDIVVVDRETAGFASEQAENAAYYECLARGTCGYQRMLSRGDLTVYARQAQLTAIFPEGRVAPQCP